MAGKRARAFEDLRVGAGGGSPAMRPGVLQMLFKGGSAKATGAADLRMGRNSFKPAGEKPLFRGGPVRPTADADLRVGMSHGQLRPGQTQMLADGGEVEEDEYSGPEVSEELVMLAEDLMDALNSYSGPSISDSDSRVERASKEAARKAKAKIVAQILKSIVQVADDDSGLGDDE